MFYHKKARFSFDKQGNLKFGPAFVSSKVQDALHKELDMPFATSDYMIEYLYQTESMSKKDIIKRLNSIVSENRPSFFAGKALHYIDKNERLTSLRMEIGEVIL